MDDIIQQIATTTNLDTETAQQAVSIVLNFLKQEGPQEDMATLFQKLPGAEALAESANNQYGEISGGLMGLAGQLSGLGLGMGQMAQIGQSLFAIAREKVGTDTMNRLADSVPGLHQFT